MKKITNEIEIKHLKDVECVKTSHGCGEKRVLMAKDETETDITQVAVTQLKAGESVESIHTTQWKRCSSC